jgi:hypothetical protein
LNSYKLGFGLLAIFVISLAYLQSKSNTPVTTPSASTTELAPLNTTVASLSTPALPPDILNPPATTSHANSIQSLTLTTLLNEIASLLQEISGLQRLLYNPFDPYQPVDETLQQTYQPHLDALSQRLETLVRKAEGISKPQTQRFLWEQALALGLEDPASLQAISLISYSLDDALFEDMLTALSNGGHTSTARSSLAFSILLPAETNYNDGNTVQPFHKATPRQRRIKAFLEEQLPQETDSEVLNAYIDVYHTMSQDGHRLVSNADFWQQLETLRAQIAPDQYFAYRLQHKKLTNPNSDLASLLRDINSTPMTPQQRQNMISLLSSNVFMENAAYSGDTLVNTQIPDPQRQLLLQYLESNLPPPTLQDRYSLYEYGNQAYAIEILKHREQATDKFYQRIVESNNVVEQTAMILGASVAGERLITKLQQHTALRQRLENQFKQSNLPPEIRTVLQDALNIISVTLPPAMPTYPNDEAGMPLYSQETVPDSGSPDGQYPGY